MSDSTLPDDERALRFAREEYRALRAEVLLRIGQQHQLLCLAWGSLLVLVLVAQAWSSPWPLLLHVVLASALAAMWAHNAVRTVQLKLYPRDDLEPRLAGDRGSWEHALAGMRARSIVRSRWFLSSRGFLLGSQALALFLAALGLSWDTRGALAWLFGLVLLAGSVILLRYPVIERRG